MKAPQASIASELKDAYKIREKIYAHPWLYKQHPAINSTKLFGKTCFVNDKPSKLLQWNVLGEICTKGYIKLFSILTVSDLNDHVTRYYSYVTCYRTKQKCKSIT